MNLDVKRTKFNNRRIAYSAVSTELALLSDQRLYELIKNAIPMGTSIGGTAALLKIGDTSVFIKKIRLTDIERQPENIMSTRNIFGLPLYYQYGIGSAGFGVWRELAVHIMTTNWVLSGECHNFPLMYHWRLLSKSVPDTPTADQLAELERDVKWWGGSSIIRGRLTENLKTSADIVIFLEYFPENLHTWLVRQLSEGDEKTIESACTMVECNINKITSFINSRGLLHFDAHFYNILTDGDELYFSDFGLAISNQFELSEEEKDFFKRNSSYDQCYTMAYFVEWLLMVLFEMKDWVIGDDNAVLHEYAAGKGRALQSAIETIIRRYLPIAVVMNDFFIQLKKSKKTLYPTNELENIFAANKIKFKSFDKHSFSLLHNWLQEPHIREFWDDGLRTLSQTEAYYGKENGVNRFIFFIDGDPAGYIQSYDLILHDTYKQFYKENKTIGIDFFIGNKKFLGKGLAKFILQKFIELHGADVARVLVDPHPKNNRAIHVYKTCGFLSLKIFNIDKNPHQIMVYDKNVTTK